MTIHEISPRQVRALLFLLVLVPFIPLGLMLRFVTDSVKGETVAAREQFAATTQHTLVRTAESLEKRLAAHPGKSNPEEWRQFCRGVFDRTVEVVVRDSHGAIRAGPASPTGTQIAHTPLKNDGDAWLLQVWLVDESELRRQAREQYRVYSWTALAAALATCAIATAAGLAVNQQPRLRELKNTSVATVAHELRTPLATMRMLVDTLREGRYRSTDQLREYLDLLNEENLRLSRLTEHFLTHSRLERGQQAFSFSPVAVDSIVDPTVAALQGKLRAPGCVFTLDLDRALPQVLADRDSLVTVLINLLDNALKYSGNEKRITLRARREGDALRFVVEDNGIGLTASERERVFEPFYQADRKLSRTRGGCGLGLSIVSAIVAAHRGRVEIASEPGEGAAFAVSIPVATV